MQLDTMSKAPGASSNGAPPPLLQTKGISRVFRQPIDLLERLAVRAGLSNAKEQVVRAVSAVDLTISAGEVVGLVGESGCGKSTLGRMVAGVMPPSSGQLLYKGRPVAGLSARDAAEFALKVQMVFQDPYSSLNPRMRVRDIIGEAPLFHGLTTRTGLTHYVSDVLTQVKLDPSYMDRFPHQFSGGQRQRIGLARAMAVNPELIVCDEAIAALDVSIQAQVLNLFLELRERFRFGYLFISHDIGVVEHISDRVIVMYLGRVVEEARTEDLFARPNHPYTQALLKSVPKIEKRRSSFEAMKGELPSPLNMPTGCPFHTRCPHSMQICKSQIPELTDIAPGHKSACHLNSG
ncbi:ABC transporter ATP-binding protein [Pseudooceanicola pacificus]|nr:oligopeptide/dipeptide ABC transporter ATP-binding protein [Pseudooceanicola pacificus]